MSNNIKELIEDNYIVICDTNVFLHIYRYSPEFSDFALRCMNTVEPYIVIPSTVKLEFLKHYRASFGDMEKRVQNVAEYAKRQIEHSSQKVLKICDTLQALHYPDISVLHKKLSDKFQELISIPESFFEDREILNFIANPWNGENLVYDLVDKIIKEGRCMVPVTQEEIYQICDEGERRYKADPQIPPGFKDAKNKDGVRKYSDLIIWKEILRYSKDNSVNILFVTNDVKNDWWVEENGQKIFHPKLLSEFKVSTGNQIISLCALDFFEKISAAYQIERSDAVEIALRITDDEYFERIQEDVFAEIDATLSFSGEEYLEPSFHMGTNGIDELEIIEHDFISAEQVYRDQDTITYIFNYQVKAEATSFDYWGRDDDSKEIILAPSAFHTFEGIVEVEVVRDANIYLDFEGDEGFETATLIAGNLKETNYESLLDSDEEEYLEGAYTTCPDCGCKINYENDGGNGFCVNCAPEH